MTNPARQEFSVRGKPYPWRTAQRGKGGWTYKVPELERWQRLVAIEARSQGAVVFEGALGLTIRAWVPRPKSHLNAKGKLRAGVHVMPVSLRTGDATNVQKGIEDALKGVAWEDDRQIVDAGIELRYADDHEPGAEIVVEVLEPPPVKPRRKRSLTR